MPEATPREHEQEDVNLRAIAWAGAALAATIALVCLAAYLLWQFWGPAQAYDAPNTPLDFKPSPPTLESAPQPARAAYFAEKEKLLNSWEWIDPKQGIARIPVEQAMRMLAARSNATQGSGT
jgi:hypothetical protein